jgi:hypothetical protein
VPPGAVVAPAGSTMTVAGRDIAGSTGAASVGLITTASVGLTGAAGVAVATAAVGLVG